MTRRLLLPLLRLAALALAAYPRLHRRLLRYQCHRAAAAATAQIAPQLRDGDLIFHTSLSAQCRAIQLATHSPYSHCGILYQQNGQWQVFEAVQPVKLTPLADWMARGQGGHFVTKRLRDAKAVLTPAALARLKAAGQPLLGHQYDLYFGWSDDRIYCSELI
ncbi:YiiX/YebB-like N1pC/P60 family cysteine hydrolase [Hymenobacter armeniacus]|uniref:YiiX/YebB-like N1pC/P60 family cysteine hydrolase n=1 Tax=Hymenobacter armeniacus TaxID=2771358 RepID=UPI001CC26BA0|nr:YiiX/YebB-like N1pC/P60 family cysteine hydrolase [Hymenobacter armeniacus]